MTRWLVGFCVLGLTIGATVFGAQTVSARDIEEPFGQLAYSESDSYYEGYFEWTYYYSSMCTAYWDSYYYTYHYYCPDNCWYYDEAYYGYYWCSDSGTYNYYETALISWDYYCYDYSDYGSYIYCWDDDCYYYDDGTSYCSSYDSYDYYEGYYEYDYWYSWDCISYDYYYYCPDGCYYYDELLGYDYYWCEDSGTQAPSTDYSDIGPWDPYIEAIDYLSDAGVIEGYSDGTYKPNADVNRVEALKIIFATLDNVLEIYEIDETDTIIGSNMDFSDVENGAWYVPYLDEAYMLGIVEGYEDGTYKPGSTVNKVEILKMIIEASITEVLYADVDTTQWYATYVQLANKLGIFYDLEVGDNFNPAENMTCGEIADMVYGFADIMYLNDNPGGFAADRMGRKR